jgi:hypothetical protein
MVDRATLARGLPGYGLEGYGLEGEGFRYPSVKTYRTKEGISPEYFRSGLKHMPRISSLEQQILGYNS